MASAVIPYFPSASHGTQQEKGYLPGLNWTEAAAQIMMQMQQVDLQLWGHSGRVARYAFLLAQAYGLDEDAQLSAALSGLLHDVGKLALPVELLCLPKRLSTAERTQVESHVALGVLQLQQLQVPPDIILAVAHHHERWDGSGYPSGLRGISTSLCGRILGVVDVFDALSTARPYKQAWQPQAVTDTLNAMAKNQKLDSILVEIFLSQVRSRML
ncbi:HD-GYP domain-containing protein [Deinococcus aquatilis]|uniref:HD-GYP domain-containing protein n=1 Tax=Deinococcus aquatilis TaxID=519440 RepID=UPI000375828B|nr:HD domain-containing phosphohydrolase [Deinococcus aquatilis]